MKKILSKIKAPVVTICYAAAVAITVVYCLTLAVFSQIMRLNGGIESQTLTLEDLTLYNAEIIDKNTAVSTNEDPQFIFPALDGTLQSVKIEMQFSFTPGEMAMYYTTKPGEAFGQNKRVWAKETDNGVYVYNLPAGVKALRLDPGNANNNTITVNSITVNPPKSFFSYFALSAGRLLALAVLPALTASVISYVVQCKKLWADRKNNKTKKEKA